MFFKAYTHYSDCSFYLLFLGATVRYLTEYRINIRLKLRNERLCSVQEKELSLRLESWRVKLSDV